MEIKQPPIDQLLGNPAIRPQDDYYHHICQSWINANPKPADRSCWSQFDLLAEQIHSQITQIIKDWENLPVKKQTAPKKQVVDLYQTILAKDQLAEAGCRSLAEIHQKYIAKLSFSNLAENLGNLNRIGCQIFWKTEVGVDIKNNKRYCLYINQDGLSFPSRDYYIGQSTLTKGHKNSFFRFINSLTKAIIKKINTRQEYGANFKDGLNSVSKSRRQIFNFETKLAQLSWPAYKVHDRFKTYNPYNWDKLIADFDFDWAGFIKASGGKPPGYLIVSQPDFLAGLLHLIKNSKIKTLKNYLTWHLINSFATNLTERMATKHFNFYERHFNKKPQIETLRRRATQAVNSHLIDTIGKEYVRRYYSAKTQDQIESIVKIVTRSLNNKVKAVKWLSPKSRTYAQKKLNTLIINLGKPDVWSKYSGFTVDRQNLVQTFVNLSQFQISQSFKKLDQKPNRSNFATSGFFGAHNSFLGSQVVGAWANQGLHSINYPATIFQSPFFDDKASLAANLGAIGSIIGHELVHNLDRIGAKYDHLGHLNPWTSEKEQEMFNQLIRPLINLADQYKIAKGFYLNGDLIVNEFFADLGGLLIVVDIIKNQKTDFASQCSSFKQLFSAYAYYHVQNSSLEYRVRKAKTDPHPDSVFRVNGVLAHIPEFYQIYNVQPGDKMFLPEDKRVSIW